jgi:hypothetical protein
MLKLCRPLKTDSLRFNLQAKQGNFFRMLGICLASPKSVFSHILPTNGVGREQLSASIYVSLAELHVVSSHVYI